MSEFLVVTGLSGAGRSQAAGSLEDLGWFVIDNLPPSLIEKIAELAAAPGTTIDRVALVVGRAHQVDILPALRTLRSDGHRLRILFLEASTPELVRRYGSTRRRHPLAGTGGVADAIDRERGLLEPLRAEADMVIDTSDLNIHQLKARLTALFSAEGTQSSMQVSVTSFGYKHGLPMDVDLVLDCRFLPNP
jgi:RNase adapter protein RapZ